MKKFKSESVRNYGEKAFKPNDIVTFDLHKDCVVKSLHLRLKGSIQYTFAVAVTANCISTIGAIVKRIDVRVNGNHMVKSVHPWLQFFYGLIALGQAGERRSTEGAAVPSAAVTDGGFIFGVTTHYTLVNESIFINFENKLAKRGRFSTLLDLRDKSSAVVEIVCGALLNVLDTSTNATFANNLLKLELFSAEAKDIQKEFKFEDYKQSVHKIQLPAGGVTEHAVDLHRSGRTQGLGLFCYDSATPWAPNDVAIDKLEIKRDGNTIIQSTTWRALQAKMRQEYGVYAPKATGISLMDGLNWFDFTHDRNLNTCVPARESDSFQLIISSSNAAAVDLVIDQHEITKSIDG